MKRSLRVPILRSDGIKGSLCQKQTLLISLDSSLFGSLVGHYSVPIQERCHRPVLQEALVVVCSQALLWAEKWRLAVSRGIGPFDTTCLDTGELHIRNPALVLCFVLCSDESWIGKALFAKYDRCIYMCNIRCIHLCATWFDGLEPHVFTM